jgi:hypothetical protein
VSREIAHKIMGLFWAFSGGIRGIFGIEVERGAFNHWGGSSGGFEPHRANVARGARRWLLFWRGKGSMQKRTYRVHLQHNPAGNPGDPEIVNLSSAQNR